MEHNIVVRSNKNPRQYTNKIKIYSDGDGVEDEAPELKKTIDLKLFLIR